MKILSLLTSTLLLAGALAIQAADGPVYKNLKPDAYDKMRADTNHVLLDVRTKKEFDGGHIPGAINIDWSSPDFAKKVGELDPNKTYLVNCAAGGRSARACNLMGSKLKFKNLYNLEGGITAWEEAGKPVKKP